MGLFTSGLSGVASAISERDIFIYSCSAQLISFEVDTISKEINCVEHECMNMSPSLDATVGSVDHQTSHFQSRWMQLKHWILRCPSTLSTVKIAFDATEMLTFFVASKMAAASCIAKGLYICRIYCG